jgi:hypothetical protein
MTRSIPRAALLAALLAGLLTGLLIAGGCAVAPVPAPNPPQPLAGNWWSDGTYRVDRRDPRSVKQYWHDQDNELELWPVSALHALEPDTIHRLDEKCRASSTPEAFWMGWKMRRGSRFPLGLICYRGRPLSEAEVTAACARVWSRGRPLVPAWHRPELRTYACREPEPPRERAR